MNLANSKPSTLAQLPALAVPCLQSMFTMLPVVQSAIHISNALRTVVHGLYPT